MFDLTNKVAIVTGGSRGIGRSVCVALAQAGAYVVVNFRSGEAAAQETLALITAAGGQGEVGEGGVERSRTADNHGGSAEATATRVKINGSNATPTHLRGHLP